MELKRGLALVSNCMRMLEQIPWPDNPHEAPFYPSADDHLARAYQELDEAEGQLRSAVNYQDEMQRGPLDALIEYTGEVLRSTRGSDALAIAHGMSPDYTEASRLFKKLPEWIRKSLLEAQNAQKEAKAAKD